MKESPWTPKKKCFWLGLVSLHLVLVVLGAYDFEWADYGHAGKWVDYYTVLSGANSGYGFFAPGIGSQLRALFDIEEKSGRKHTLELTSTKSHEAEIRVGDIIEQFLTEDGEKPDRDLQRSMAASLAGTMFARTPGAKSVTIRLEEFTPVSRNDYLKGVRPEWIPTYSAKFERKTYD